MSADMEFSAGLSDREFAAGMKRIETMAERGGSRIANYLRFGLISKAAKMGMRQASAAIEEFNKTSEDGRRTTEEFEAEINRLQAAVGEGLVDTMREALPAIKGVVDGLISGYQAAVDWAAVNIFGGNEDEIEKVNLLRAQNRELDKGFQLRKKEFEVRKAIKDQQLKDAPSLVKRANDDNEMDQRRIVDPHGAELLKIHRDVEKAARELEEATSSLTDQEKERLGVAEAMAAIYERGRALSDEVLKHSRAEQAQLAATQAKERDDAEDRWRKTLEQSEIERLRIDGMQEQADLMARQAQLAERLADLAQETALSEADRAAIARDLRDAYQAQERAIEGRRRFDAERPSNARGLSGQGASAGLIGQVFGSGGERSSESRDTLRSMVRLEKTAGEILRVFEAAGGDLRRLAEGGTAASYAA